MAADKTKTAFVIIFLLVSISPCLLFGTQPSKNEKPPIGYGAAIIYNFHATGWGVDLRTKVPIVRPLFVVPEVSYYPSFNDYHEWYAGAALHYEIMTIRHYNLYLLAAGYYNKWINAESYAPGEKKVNNFAPEGGAGLVRNQGCLRPFIENRYDIKWKENSLRIGIYIYPGDCGPKEACPGYGN